MERRAASYLLESVLILMAHPAYVVVPVLLNSTLYFSGRISNYLETPFVITIYIALALVIPVYYGQLIEIMETGAKKEWKILLKKYWLKIFVVSALLRFPVVFLAMLFPIPDVLSDVLSLAIIVISIYVLPLVLMSDDILEPMIIGLKCSIGNFKFGLPFIIVLILRKLMSLGIGTIAIRSGSLPVFYGTSIFLIIVSRTVDLMIFISAALVLKDKLVGASDAKILLDEEGITE